MSNFRGSQKHLLDLLDEFGTHLPVFNRMLSGFAEIGPMDVYRPRSTQEPDEYTLRAFPQIARLVDCYAYAKFDEWWVHEEYKNPTWDLLCTATVGDKPGLVLVEAKAHLSELKEEGKTLASGASAQSRANHGRIAECIAEASRALHDTLPGMVDLSIDSHYQLANRIASVWKLASCGLPVVLLYLGFAGDTYFNDYFQNDAEWQKTMQDHLKGVFPRKYVNTPLIIDGTLMSILIRSLPIKTVSVRT
jgi:hypothetical protein